MLVLQSVKKRDGQVVDFNEEKIITAVARAFNGKSMPKKLMKRIYQLMEVADVSSPVSIETIQDIVEMALIKEGHIGVAKDYILFRDEKAKLREQKMKLLGVDVLSDVEKRYSYNALRIFKERYLLKDNNGQIVERLDDLFRRVAVASGVMEVLYDEEFYDKNGKQYVNPKHVENMKDMIKFANQEYLSKIDYKDLYGHKNDIKWQGFSINPFHMDRLMARYLELLKEGKMKRPWAIISDRILTNTGLQQRYLRQIQKYYDLMAHKVFLPNTPTLMNAGTRLSSLAACYTIAIEDNIQSIGENYVENMVISKSGGGVGCNYSKLRPEGDIIKSTGGTSSGVISFMSVVDKLSDVIKQGSKRRSANMGELDISHPEILKFIKVKNNKTKELENFNISAVINDEFIKAFFENKDFNLTFNNKVYQSINARTLMDMITINAHETGDPGAIFLENVNRNNFLQNVFGVLIKETNPCAEEAMYPYDSCNLASINLTKFVKDGRFDANEFMAACSIVTQFLDGIIDANKYPLNKINEMSKQCRRLGLGFMGLGDVFTQLGVKYNSEKGFTLIEYISAIMTGASLYTSAHMANIKGSFPLYYHKDYPKEELPVNAMLQPELMGNLQKRMNLIKQYLTDDAITEIIHYYTCIPHQEMGLRNVNTTTSAPTGTLSMFVDVSSGIEPIFSHGFTKKVTIGEFDYVNKFLEEALKSEKIYSNELISKIVRQYNGRLSAVSEIPQHLKEIFITAMEIHPFDHIIAQASAQKWITNGISKTCNVPNDITTQDIEKCYLLAWATGCKGITAYRDGSKHTQVLNNTSVDKTKSNLNASEFTVNWIKNLNNIPEEYKQELLKTCNCSDTFPDPKITETHTMSIYCPSCGASNSLQSSGGRCQLCVACGTGIGSCN